MIKTKKAMRTPQHEWSYIQAIAIMNLFLLSMTLYWTQWLWIPLALQVSRTFFNVENELIETSGNKVYVEHHEQHDRPSRNTSGTMEIDAMEIRIHHGKPAGYTSNARGVGQR